jgi:phosphoglycolate phosphatase
MLIRRALGDPKDGHHLQEALNYFMQYYREHKLDNTYAYHGVPEMLRAIRESLGLNMAVLTNKPVRPSRDIVAGLGLAEFFAQNYGGNSFETKKPDPLGAKKLLEEFHVAPEQAVMIGDSSNDVLTATNTGMWSLGVTYGFAPHTLEQVPPDVLVDRSEEIAEALGARFHANAEVPTREGFIG